MTSKVLLGRKAFFGATRQLIVPDATEPQNRAWFGKASQLHGHDYIVEAFYQGKVDETDGMIVNITDLKPFLNEAADHFDGNYLNDLEEFQGTPPTLENIINRFWNRLPFHLDNGNLHRIHIQESPYLQATKTIDMTSLTRSYEFCAAHRLYTKHLSEEENKKRYGKCSNPAGHGHNYRLSVTLQGDIDQKTGQIIALPALDEIIEKQIMKRFDHRHLNVDCPEFADLVPTSENFARVIFEILQPELKMPHARLTKVGLHETYKNYFEVGE